MDQVQAMACKGWCRAHAPSQMRARVLVQDEQKTAGKLAHDAEQGLEVQVSHLEATLAHLDGELLRGRSQVPAEVAACWVGFVLAGWFWSAGCSRGQGRFGTSSFWRRQNEGLEGGDGDCWEGGAWLGDRGAAK